MKHVEDGVVAVLLFLSLLHKERHATTASEQS